MVCHRGHKGPLLFIIYINDINRCIEDCRCSLYNVDTAIYCSNVSYIEFILALRTELESVRQWLTANRLALNVSKTKYILIGTKPKVSEINNMVLQIGTEAIEHMETFKYVGLILDEGLTFEPHLDKFIQ